MLRVRRKFFLKRESRKNIEKNPKFHHEKMTLSFLNLFTSQTKYWYFIPKNRHVKYLQARAAL